MKNYDRDEIIAKLQRNGLKPAYHKNSRYISYFKKPKNRNIGIKLLGYLDFLGVTAK